MPNAFLKFVNLYKHPNVFGVNISLAISLAFSRLKARLFYRGLWQLFPHIFFNNIF